MTKKEAKARKAAWQLALAEIKPGDFVIDEASAELKKGRVLYRDLGRPDAFFVHFTDGSTTSVGTGYLRKLKKNSAHNRI